MARSVQTPDVLLFLDDAVPLGSVATARLIGVLEVEQKDQGEPWERNDRFFAVISVDQQEVDRPIPRAHGFLAESFDPNNLGSCFHGDCPSGRAAQEVQHGHSRKMERIHEI